MAGRIYNAVLGVLVMVLTLFAKGAVTIDCYVCRGCAEVGPANVQTCPATTDPNTEAPLEPTTDQDMNFDLSIDGKAQVSGYGFLEEAEVESPRSRSAFVVDDSALPGSEFLTRTLKQYRSDDDEARCVIAVFQENGQLDVVRGCSTASDNEETRCVEAIGEGFSGTLDFCHLCEDDLCNSAAKSTIALLLIAAGVLVNMQL